MSAYVSTPNAVNFAFERARDYFRFRADEVQEPEYQYAQPQGEHSPTFQRCAERVDQARDRASNIHFHFHQYPNWYARPIYVSDWSFFHWFTRPTIVIQQPAPVPRDEEEKQKERDRTHAIISAVCMGIISVLFGVAYNHYELAGEDLEHTRQVRGLLNSLNIRGEQSGFGPQALRRSIILIGHFHEHDKARYAYALHLIHFLGALFVSVTAVFIGSLYHLPQVKTAGVALAVLTGCWMLFCNIRMNNYNSLTDQWRLTKGPDQRSSLGTTMQSTLNHGQDVANEIQRYLNTSRQSPPGSVADVNEEAASA